jgi:hypothetical protein
MGNRFGGAPSIEGIINTVIIKAIHTHQTFTAMAG